MEKCSRFFWFLALQGLMCFLLMLIIPSDPKNAVVLGLSIFRLASVGGFLLVILMLLWVGLQVQKNTNMGWEVQAFINGSTTRINLAHSIVLITTAGILGSAIFFLAWISLYPRYSAYFLRLSPVILFMLLICVQVFLRLRAYFSNLSDRICQFRVKINQSLSKYKITLIFTLILFLLFGLLYIQLVERHAQNVNIYPQFSDQDSYMDIALKAYQSGFQYKGDRNRTPLFPYLMAVFYKPDMPRVIFFRRSQQMNLALSIISLSGIFFIARRYIPGGQSLVFTLIAAVSLFVYKAGYVQPELLFYFLFFVSFILMCKLLLKPNYWLSAAVGLSLAFSYLTKAAVLPTFVSFIMVYTAQLFFFWIKNLKNQDESKPAKDVPYIRVVNLVVMVAAFLALLSPYLLENKRLFRSYFYNVNTTFYAWYDSWEQVEEGTKSHGDNIGWPDLPSEQIPSLRKYLQEHTPQQILRRFASGFEGEVKFIIKPYSRFNYPAIYTITVIALGLYNIRLSLQLCKRYFFLLIFTGMFFGINLISFAWFSPIAGFYLGRFLYGLYLPFLFCLFVALYQLGKELQTIHFLSKPIQVTDLVWVIHMIVLLMVFYEILFFTPNRLAVGYWYGK